MNMLEKMQAHLEAIEKGNVANPQEEENHGAKSDSEEESEESYYDS